MGMDLMFSSPEEHWWMSHPRSVITTIEGLTQDDIGRDVFVSINGGSPGTSGKLHELTSSYLSVMEYVGTVKTFPYSILRNKGYEVRVDRRRRGWDEHSNRWLETHWKAVEISLEEFQHKHLGAPVLIGHHTEDADYTWSGFVWSVAVGDREIAILDNEGDRIKFQFPESKKEDYIILVDK